METNQGAGTAAQQTTGNPGEGQSNVQLPPEVQGKMAELEKQAAEAVKAKKDLEEIQNYFGARRELYDAALMYDKDQNFQKMVKDYVSSGGKTSQQGASEHKAEAGGLDLSFLDDQQKSVLNQYIEQIVGSKMKGVEGAVSQLKGYVTQAQISDMRNRYTKDKGFPFNFQEVEGDIASLITGGKAVDAETAYLQLVGSRYPGVRAELDKTIKDQKRQISMTRSATPTSYPMKGGGPKTFLEAIQQAQEQVGK